jgi:ribosomal protein S18 acetylase RimI-like enzyme
LSEAAGGLPVRRAGAADIDAIVALRIDFERITRDSGSMDEGARRAELAGLLGPDLASGRLLCWLAADGDRPVAQAALRLLPGGTGELMNVYVAPAFRRRGLGAALVASAIAEAAERGLARVTLEPTEDSRALYERAGFVAAGRRMTLDLTAGARL